MNRTTPLRRRVLVIGLVPVLFSTVLASVAPLATASASSGPTNVLTVTGGLKGTLKVVANLNCDGSSANGVNLSWSDTKLAPRKAAEWALNIFTPHYGTFTRFGTGQKTTVTLTTVNFHGWVATKGTITTKGETGSINVTLGAFEGGASGTTYVKGSWNCA